MKARFEVVRTPAGWHARFRAGNGRIVWLTEPYSRKDGAYNAIYVMDTEAAADAATPFRIREIDDRPPRPPTRPA